MPMSFEHVFLGPEHSYVTTVTKTNSTKIPLEPARSESYGIPASVEAALTRFQVRSHIYNVKGNDFLSYAGQHSSKRTLLGSLTTLPVDSSSPSLSATNPTVPITATIYDEIRELQLFALADENISGKKANLITSYGPAPGSFFADSFGPKGLKRYRWANLPADLDSELQDIVGRGGYTEARITSVCLNALNGWVVVRKGGKLYSWGGVLPSELEEALETGRRGGIAINRIFLNHQHPTEYLMLLDNGKVYARLHKGFKEKLAGLVREWAQGNGMQKRLGFHFHVSCECDEKYQARRNADYYNARGIFQLRRGQPLLSSQYLREAHTLSPSDREIRRNYGLALMALRPVLNDKYLEDYLEGRGPPVTAEPNADFRCQYIMMLETINELAGTVVDCSVWQSEWSFRNEVISLLPDGRPREMFVENPLSPASTLGSRDDPAEMSARSQ